MTIFRFWYHGAYVDVPAETPEEAKSIVETLACVSNGKISTCVPIISEPERLDD